jgi:hypothetical protein
VETRWIEPKDVDTHRGPAPGQVKGKAFLRTQAVEAQGGAARLGCHVYQIVLAAWRLPAPPPAPQLPEIFCQRSALLLTPNIDTPSIRLPGSLPSFPLIKSICEYSLVYRRRRIEHASTSPCKSFAKKKFNSTQSERLCRLLA